LGKWTTVVVFLSGLPAAAVTHCVHFPLPHLCLFFPQERLFAILCMLLGSAMFAYVVGTMCSVVQGLSETSLAFQSRMDRINEYMVECKLPSSLRSRVRKYCLYQRDANLIRAEERRLLSTLSPALRSEISSFNYEIPLRSARYFKDAPREFIHSLSEFLALAIFGKRCWGCRFERFSIALTWSLSLSLSFTQPVPQHRNTHCQAPTKPSFVWVLPAAKCTFWPKVDVK
jgi:hypothetical protein